MGSGNTDMHTHDETKHREQTIQSEMALMCNHCV